MYSSIYYIYLPIKKEKEKTVERDEKTFQIVPRFPLNGLRRQFYYTMYVSKCQAFSNGQDIVQ